MTTDSSDCEVVSTPSDVSRQGAIGFLLEADAHASSLTAKPSAQAAAEVVALALVSPGA